MSLMPADICLKWGRFCLAFLFAIFPLLLFLPLPLTQLEDDDDDDDCNHNNKPIAKQKRATAKGRQNKLSKKLFFKMTRAKEDKKRRGRERGKEREGEGRRRKEKEAEGSKEKLMESEGSREAQR